MRDWAPQTDFQSTEKRPKAKPKQAATTGGKKATSKATPSAKAATTTTSKASPSNTKKAPRAKAATTTTSKASPSNTNETTKGRWGWESMQARKNFPMVFRTIEKVTGWDHITLRSDPDSESKQQGMSPIEGRIRYIVSRGHLFVVLRSKNPKHMELERAVLVKGSDYPEAKQRFKDGDGPTVESSSSSYLARTDWRDFQINNIATTLDGKMTIIEGYHDSEGKREMRMFSITTLRQAYGKSQADALALWRRAMVGQERLTEKEKKQRLPEDVIEFLTARNLET